MDYYQIIADNFQSTIETIAWQKRLSIAAN
jgi:hypothetical protein